MTPSKPKALLLYDATCRLCQFSSRQVLQMVPEGTFKPVDINRPEIQARFNISPEAARREMHIVTGDGKIYRGAEAVRFIMTQNGWLKPLSYMWKVPGFDQLAQSGYLWVSDHRYLFLGKDEQACDDEACSVHLGKAANSSLS